MSLYVKHTKISEGARFLLYARCVIFERIMRYIVVSGKFGGMQPDNFVLDNFVAR